MFNRLAILAKNAHSTKNTQSTDRSPAASSHVERAPRPALRALSTVFAVAVGLAALTGCSSAVTGTSAHQTGTRTHMTSSPADTTVGGSEQLRQQLDRIRTALESTSTSDLSATKGDSGVSRVSVVGVRTMDQYLTAVVNDVHTYWGAVFTRAGQAAPQVNYRWPSAGQYGSTPCSWSLTTDESAFYCATDDRITISQEFARTLWTSQGDFAVAFVVAHEYAHNVQAEVGIFGAKLPTVNTELHADCLAGMWANSAYYKGILEAGDIEEGIAATQVLGDFEFSNPDHHGTPDQRTAAFMTGYNTGSSASCQPILTGAY